MKKITVVAGVASMFALIIAVPFAQNALAKDSGEWHGGAQMMNDDDEHDNSSTRIGMPMRIENEDDTKTSAEIDANGNFKVTGVTVNSVSSSTNMINVSFFGFTQDVNLAGARLIGAGNAISVGDIQPGDVLSGHGNWNASTKTLTVSQIRDVSYQARHASDVQSRIQQLWNLIKQLQDQLKGMF